MSRKVPRAEKALSREDVRYAAPIIIKERRGSIPQTIKGVEKRSQRKRIGHAVFRNSKLELLQSKTREEEEDKESGSASENEF